MAQQATIFRLLLLALLYGGAVAAHIEESSGIERDGDESSEYFPHDEEHNEDTNGKLNMITTSPEKIEGFYYSEDGGGIHFLSEFLSEKAELTIRTLGGNILITSVQYQQGVLLTVMGRQFLIINSSTTERRKLTGFAVPAEYSDQIVENLKANEIPLKTLRNLDFDGGVAARQSAYEELLARPEIDMIIDAAQILGSSGVMGAENPSAFSFYMLALRFSKFRPQQQQQENLPEDETGHPLQRNKRSHCWWNTHCSNNGRCCSSCPQGSNCLGLCGPGCSCWWFVCGNCCYNSFCYDHDICCSGPNGYNTWGCSVPVQYLLTGCSSSYWCYSDAPIG